MGYKILNEHSNFLLFVVVVVAEHPSKGTEKELTTVIDKDTVFTELQIYQEDPVQSLTTNKSNIQSKQGVYRLLTIQ